jgi:alpha-beta hydrolase superfamily lysophospholipase
VKAAALQRILLVIALLFAIAGCSSDAPEWVEDEVTFTADGLTIHGTYRHEKDAQAGPAALLLSESGPTDRNGDNAVIGDIGTMRQLAEWLSDRPDGKGVASLRFDKVGTGKTGLGPYTGRPNDVVSAVYSAGAKAAARFLADQPGTDKERISVYALGEGGVHAMQTATDTAPGAPKIHSLALLQPLPGRYLDIITNRVRADGSPQTLAEWLAAVNQLRTTGTLPAKLPEGLSAIVSPGNLKAVVDADKVDPVALAARIPAGTPVLLTCSDTDRQADCKVEQPLIAALDHTALTVVELKGVNHVLHDDASDDIANLTKGGPLSPQLTTALDGFVSK